MQSMTINGHPITYVEYGNAGSDALILLPGWAQDHRLFKNLAPLLAADFHVICLNYRGHDGDQTLLSDFTEADLVDDTAEFVGRKQLGSFHLVSTSHGCWVNIDLCERFLWRADTMVLTSFNVLVLLEGEQKFPAHEVVLVTYGQPNTRRKLGLLEGKNSTAIQLAENAFDVLVRARDDMHGDDLADLRRRRRAGVSRRLDRADVAAHHDGD